MKVGRPEAIVESPTRLRILVKLPQQGLIADGECSFAASQSPRGLASTLCSESYLTTHGQLMG